MKVLALSGHAGSGKDTVAKILQLIDSWNNSKYFKQRYPDQRDFVKHFIKFPSIAANSCSEIKCVAFADPLKKCIATICNIPIELLYDQEGKQVPNNLGLKDPSDGHIYSYRELLQRFGTEAGQSVAKNIWIESVFNQIESQGRYIITDVRFLTELNSCKEKGAITVRINRNTDVMLHSSETELDECKDFNVYIDNNGTLDDLVDKVINSGLINYLND